MDDLDRKVKYQVAISALEDLSEELTGHLNRCLPITSYLDAISTISDEIKVVWRVRALLQDAVSCK